MDEGGWVGIELRLSADTVSVNNQYRVVVEAQQLQCVLWVVQNLFQGRLGVSE